MTSPAREKSQPSQSPSSAGQGRVERQTALGQVKVQAARRGKEEKELVRLIVRARAKGCSLRDIAAVAGYGSHHRVRELLARHGPAQPSPNLPD